MVTPIRGVTHDVVIEKGTDRYGFRIVPETSRMERVNQVSPITAISADPIFSEGAWRSWVQQSWIGGVGQEYWDDPTKYHGSAGGGPCTRIPGHATLETIKSASTGGTGFTAFKFLEFANMVFGLCATGNQVVESNDTTISWAQSVGSLLAQCTDGVVFAGNLFVFVGHAVATNYGKYNAGGIVTTATLGAAGGTGYTLNDVLTVVQTSGTGCTVTASTVVSGEVTGITLTTGGLGYRVANGLATTGGTGTGCTINLTVVNSWNALDYTADFGCAFKDALYYVSDGVLYSDTDPKLVAGRTTIGSVGDVKVPVTNMCAFGSYLYIFKEDGLFYYDGTAIQQAMSFPQRRSSSNGKLMVEYNGFLYFNILNEVYKYSPSAIISITPRFWGTDTAERYNYGTPKAGCVAGNMLVVAFDDGYDGARQYILAYNELGWSTIWRGVSLEIYGVSYGRISSRLWFSNTNITEMRLQANSDRPYPSYATEAILYTSWHRGAFPDQFKAYKSVILKTRGCTTTETITVSYEADQSGTWVPIGTVSTSPRAELAMAGISGVVQAKELRLRFVFARGSDATLTPILERFQVQFMDRLPAIYGHSIRLLLGDDIELLDMSLDDRTEMVQRRFLKSCASSASPLVYVDQDGYRHRVYMNNLIFYPSKVRDDGKVRGIAQVEMVDAYSGLLVSIELGVHIAVTTEVFKRTVADGYGIIGDWSSIHAGYGKVGFGQIGYGAAPTDLTFTAGGIGTATQARHTIYQNLVSGWLPAFSNITQINLDVDERNGMVLYLTAGQAGSLTIEDNPSGNIDLTGGGTMEMFTIGDILVLEYSTSSERWVELARSIA